MKPFFSIITCTKNSERYLRQNIDSVTSQTFKDYEHIFIDGKSNDNTLMLINEYFRGNDKVGKFSYPPRGISNAFNHGIDHSSGKFLIFLNSDDYLCDRHVLNNIYSFLNTNPDLDWIYGKICEVNGKNTAMGIFPKYKVFHRNNYFLLKFFNYIPHQAVIINKVIFEEYGKFDEHIKYMMDYEYWLRIGKLTKWKFINIEVTNYRYWDGGRSSSKNIFGELENEKKMINDRYLNKFEAFCSSLVSNLARYHYKYTLKFFFNTHLVF